VGGFRRPSATDLPAARLDPVRCPLGWRRQPGDGWRRLTGPRLKL